MDMSHFWPNLPRFLKAFTLNSVCFNSSQVSIGVFFNENTYLLDAFKDSGYIVIFSRSESCARLQRF